MLHGKLRQSSRKPTTDGGPRRMDELRGGALIVTETRSETGSCDMIFITIPEGLEVIRLMSVIQSLE
jgi:hypothetical protein